jgi:hypothetical protein
LARYRIETQVANMDFFRLDWFRSSHRGAVVEFSPIANYHDLWRRIHIDKTSRGSHVVTGNVTVFVDSVGPQEALDSVEKLLIDYEHLLMLAHYHDVFFSELSCFEQDSNQIVATREPGGRRGKAESGCLLWAEFIPQFLTAALPRLDVTPGFRWALYWYNEVTALSPSQVPEIEVPSLWTAFESVASSIATASGKDKLLSDKEIEKLKDRVRPILVEMIFDANTRSQIYRHFKALTHPIILDTAKDLLEEYRLLEYMSEVESFYQLRIDIVHGRPLKLPAKVVIKRMFRFRRLLQKLLFSMAGIYGMADAFYAPIRLPDLSAI